MTTFILSPDIATAWIIYRAVGTGGLGGDHPAHSDFELLSGANHFLSTPGAAWGVKMTSRTQGSIPWYIFALILSQKINTQESGILCGPPNHFDTPYVVDI